MKVLYVINGLGTGGAERSLAEMLPLLRGKGVDATIACFNERTEGVHRSVVARGYDVRLIESSTWRGRIKAIRSLTKAERPDLVHTTIFEADIVGRLAAAGTGTPVVSSIVNTPYDPVRLRDPAVRRSRFFAARAVEAVTGRLLVAHYHAITHAVKDAAVKRLGVPPDRITVVERGRDPERLGSADHQRRGRVRRALGLGHDREILLNVGRQEYQKGQVFLIEAMDPLRQTHPEAILLVAGRTGQMTEELRRTVKERGLEESVRFLGHRDDVPDLMTAADLFVFPSLYEGLGGALIEAMALSLPIVASRIPVFEECLEDGGNAVLVAPESPDEIAVAVGGLLENEKEMDRFGRRGRELFCHRFTLESSVTRLVELYEQVATGSGAYEDAIGVDRA